MTVHAQPHPPFDAITTFVINLDGSDERLSLITENLTSLNIPFERVPAVDGRRFDVHALPEYNDRRAKTRYGRTLNGGEIGCFKSHIKCLQKMIDDDLPFALIIEDDMQAPDDFSQVLQECFDQLQTYDPNWHCVHFDAPSYRYMLPVNDIGSGTLFHSFFLPSNTGCILWSQQGARSFLGSYFAKVISGPIDAEMRSHMTRTGKGYMIMPPPMTPRRLKSDIDSVTNRLSNVKNGRKSNAKSKIMRHFPDHFWSWVNMTITRLKKPR